MIKYRIIRSGRRTVALEIKSGGDLIVRAPYFMSKSQIDKFVTSKEKWILKVLERRKLAKMEAKNLEAITVKELKTLAAEAAGVLPKKVAYYTEKVEIAAGKSIETGRIAIKAQKTLWGSCSAKGNLNFNCLLMKCPEAVLDYVVVHELCHRVEMNHSQDFWKLVEKVCPNYKAERKWLKNRGHLLMEQLRNTVDE